MAFLLARRHVGAALPTVPPYPIALVRYPFFLGSEHIAERLTDSELRKASLGTSPFDSASTLNRMRVVG